MAIIVAHWEIPAAWQGGFASKKAFSRYSHTAKAFGVTELRFVERDPMPDFGDQEVQLKKYPDLEAALKGLTNLVYVEEGGTPIREFDFPDDPVFVFGSDYGELERADVSIGGALPLHADISLGIVLEHWSGA